MARKLYEYMAPAQAGLKLLESEDGKDLFMAGLFIQGDTKNQNGRVYPKSEIERAVESVRSRLGTGETVLGELDHPEELQINLDRVSHIITDMSVDGSDGLGKLKIIDTPMGNIARSLIEGGAQLGVSSRGMGSLKMVNGVNVVQPDFYLATAADIVADPSAPGAFVQGIMEGKEWMLVDGKWTEVHLEEAIQQVRKASRKEIEQVSLQIFETFLRKL